VNIEGLKWLEKAIKGTEQEKETLIYEQEFASQSDTVTIPVLLDQLELMENRYVLKAKELDTLITRNRELELKLDAKEEQHENKLQEHLSYYREVLHEKESELKEVRERLEHLQSRGILSRIFGIRKKAT
jgi:DNA repair exonuclease SbcCD ATPase subunit